MIQKVVVFGGSFSPPTLAHTEIIARCLAVPGIDEVWLVPSANRTDKNIAARPRQQLAMLELVVRDVFHGDSRLRILDTELRRGISTETYDTYQEFLRDYPEADLWFVFGSDSYATIGQWLNGDWLAEHLPVMIVPRNGVPLPRTSAIVQHLSPLSAQAAPISSTQVRSILALKSDASALVSTPIATYLKQNELFASKS
ncbi:nicotinate-nicotinamide nucleotide adenylyltransferase [Candidatus Saccharibacteria bacterium]|nr:MAG: nicotinate-nicotinamide nucleotide adenylyltransferase [Candidatus Saccharibacteria bacterium]